MKNVSIESSGGKNYTLGLKEPVFTEKSFNNDKPRTTMNPIQDCLQLIPKEKTVVSVPVTAKQKGRKINPVINSK
jgi:hypothetical protein